MVLNGKENKRINRKDLIVQVSVVSDSVTKPAASSQQGDINNFFPDCNLAREMSVCITAPRIIRMELLTCYSSYCGTNSADTAKNFEVKKHSQTHDQ